MHRCRITYLLLLSIWACRPTNPRNGTDYILYFSRFILRPGLGSGISVLMQKVIVFVIHVLQLSCIVSLQMSFILVLSFFCAASLCLSNLFIDRKHLISVIYFFFLHEKFYCLPQEKATLQLQQAVSHTCTGYRISEFNLFQFYSV